MPYIIQPGWGGKWIVRKKWTGKKIGTTDSYAKALGMIKAIYANEGKTHGK